MVRIARDLAKFEDRLISATLYYNVGSVLRGRSQYRCALRYYRKAYSLNPDYGARDYSWREVGGLLFLMHRYKTAAWAYCRAIEEQGDQGSDSYLVRLLHADCLMFSGQYAIAISELENSLEPRASHEDAEWVLKLEALRWLVSRFGIRSGSRNVRAAIERMATVGFSDATLEASCLDALTLDALCSQSWGKLGVHYSNLEKDNNEMRRTAAMCLMMGGFVLAA